MLVTDGEVSFVMFSYGDMQWKIRPFIGFNSRSRTFTVVAQSSKNLMSSSNVGYPGLYIYRVDENIVEPTFNSSGGYLNKYISDLVELYMLATL